MAGSLAALGAAALLSTNLAVTAGLIAVTPRSAWWCTRSVFPCCGLWLAIGRGKGEDPAPCWSVWCRLVATVEQPDDGDG